jgi:thiaminase
VLKAATADIQQQAEEAFVKVARFEQDFWQMVFNAN